MKNFVKFSIAASAVMALTGSVYAIPTLYLSDGDTITGLPYLSSSSSGAVTESITTTIDGWSLVIVTGTSHPPAGGGGTAELPSMDVSIEATYVGTGGAGSTLSIYFGSDGFGPSSASFISHLTGNVTTGTGLGVTYNTYDTTGSAVPTVANPIPVGAHGLTASGSVLPTPNSGPGGSYSSLLTGGPITMSSYSLEEVITISGASSGSGYSLDASLTAVPDGGMTLMLLGSALSGLALLKKKLF